MLERLGKEVYKTDHEEVSARGVEIDATTLTNMKDKIKSIHNDQAGKNAIRQMLAGITSTGFAKEQLENMLAIEPQTSSSRIGEIIAEIYIKNEYNCEFPCPVTRDLKNQAASPAGADLVGFQRTTNEPNPSFRFAFGEVKTSTEAKWPPSVSRSLQEQINNLRDSIEIKSQLILYLSHHAVNADWAPMHQNAAERYFNSECRDTALFGVLVRDVEAKENDLKNHAFNSALNKPTETLISFTALYLPANSITNTLPNLFAGEASS